MAQWHVYMLYIYIGLYIGYRPKSICFLLLKHSTFFPRASVERLYINYTLYVMQNMRPTRHIHLWTEWTSIVIQVLSVLLWRLGKPVSSLKWDILSQWTLFSICQYRKALLWVYSKALKAIHLVSLVAKGATDFGNIMCLWGEFSLKL